MSLPTGNDGTPATRRLFLALNPDDVERRQLRDAVREHLPPGRARWVALENLHMTLIFFGSVTAAVQACIEQAVAAVDAPGFALTLERFGYWPRSHMLWAMPSELPAALLQLVDSLQSALFEQCGIKPDERSFTAHVTLGRKVNRAPRASRFTPVTWTVMRITLMESASTPDGVRYIERAAWPLRAPQ